MKAVIAVISDLSTDMRIQKHALLLSEMGFEVTLTGRRTGSMKEIALPGIRIERLRVPFRKGPLMYLWFNAALMMRLLFFRKAHLYVANDLDTLIPCYMASRLYGKPLVYDAHEYFTGQYSLAHRRLKRCLWKQAERLLLPKIHNMITVNDSIAELYRQEYGADPIVIRNLPMAAGHIKANSRADLGVSADDLLAVFQDGSGHNPGRGLTELLEAMKTLENVRLLIIGSGDRIGEARHKVQNEGLERKVVFLPRMNWDELISWLKCCDVGLSIDKDTCVNQRYSLPNKLFDAIVLGMPVIVSPLPEVSATVRRYGCGLVIDEVTPRVIAEKLAALRDDRLALQELKAKAEEAAPDLSWDNEKTREQDFFRSVIEKRIK